MKRIGLPAPLKVPFNKALMVGIWGIRDGSWWLAVEILTSKWLSLGGFSRISETAELLAGISLALDDAMVREHKFVDPIPCNTLVPVVRKTLNPRPKP